MSRKALIAITAVLVPAGAVAAQAASSKSITLKSESASGMSINVLAAPSGRTLYRLKPETARHVLCKTDCLQFWPALTVKSKKTKVKLPDGIKGKIGYLKRGKRYQVTLGGKPLYTYSGDSATGQVNGQNIKTFGGTWLSLPVKSSSTQNTLQPNTSPPPAPPTSPPPTGPPPVPYPPYPY
jgi:predicted lipoprotein with Yx(FWY)xxD motif